MNISKKVLVTVVMVAVAVVFWVIFKKITAPENFSASPVVKIKIVTTLFPVYDFAKRVGGDLVEVKLLLPPGMEAHAFRPKSSDLIAINQADVFIYTHPQMETWVPGVLAGIDNKSLKIISAGEGIDLLPLSIGEMPSTAAESAGDPHFWLDLDRARAMVENIKHGLIAVDHYDESYYRQNASELEKDLDLLDQDFRSDLKNCFKTDIVVAGHAAWGYLARRYHFNYFSAQGMSPTGEMTNDDLIKLINQIQAKDLNYIYYEELVNSRTVQLVFETTGARLLFLHGVHNVSWDDFTSGISFGAIMRDNLNNLTIGLECD